MSRLAIALVVALAATGANAQDTKSGRSKAKGYRIACDSRNDRDTGDTRAANTERTAIAVLGV